MGKSTVFECLSVAVVVNSLARHGAATSEQLAAVVAAAPPAFVPASECFHKKIEMNKTEGFCLPPKIEHILFLVARGK